ncbi:carbohydrate-binding domain-containing protein [Demequina pelophila]|uniref:carbohydrate-binding domain-containing protein n=1 Tax=Demequina pelophila TaxID=1638984 RepID=UPI000783B51E|nr:carbohydrate-binding domain-containing protein [Demequina pelophila]
MRTRSLILAGAIAGTLGLAGCTATVTGTEDSSSAATAAASSTSDATASSTDGSGTTATQTVAAAADLVENTYDQLQVKSYDVPVDESQSVDIELADGATSAGDGFTVDGDTVTIVEGGVYRLSGELTAGQVVVATDDKDVTLILDDVSITAAATAAIEVQDADEVVVWLADGSDNYLADSGSAAATDEEDAPNAVLYSTEDMYIGGDGSLTVEAGVEDGITSKDGLVIAGGTIEVTAADDGIRGKDHLIIEDGDITVDAGGDGLRSDNEADEDDATHAVGVLWVTGGQIDVTALADAIDTYNQVTIEGGSLTLDAEDDGIHTEGVLHISGGTVDVTNSYEGFEGGVIRLSGGEGTVVASDDGFNATSGSSSSGTGGDMGGMGGGATGDMGDMGSRSERGSGGPGGTRGPGASADGTATDASTTASSTATTATTTTATVSATYSDATATAADTGSTTTVQTAMGGDQASSGVIVEISGGTWYVDAGGDGLDSNGTLTMTGGTVIVDGPTNNGNGPLDVNGSAEISGGTLAASGSSGMLESPTATGDQGVLVIAFASAVQAGTAITVTDSDGDHVATFTTGKTSQSLVLSTADIVTGQDYTVTVGATVSGSATHGLVTDGSASGGNELGTVTAR